MENRGLKNEAFPEFGRRGLTKLSLSAGLKEKMSESEKSQIDSLFDQIDAMAQKANIRITEAGIGKN